MTSIARDPRPLALLLPLLFSSAGGAQGSAKLNCKITENGESATGTVVLLAGDREVARGSCGRVLSAAPGEYTAVLGLDGALDSPEQRHKVELQSSGPAEVAADFSTGELSVNIMRQQKRAAGMAVIRRGGKQVGTLGSGVSAHLSAGRYEVVARYRSAEKRFEAVQIERGKKIVLDADFE
ncbi:MAG: hypothetical protein OEZ06_09745 [Myxococcales bacterium]|nr:hypothetical protein [Myxococcales bacterium]